jgi:6-phosphofructokinase 1
VLAYSIGETVWYCSFVERTFGFETAVEQAQAAISAAHEEARGAKYGVGIGVHDPAGIVPDGMAFLLTKLSVSLYKMIYSDTCIPILPLAVKLMGRDSGFVALHASLANCDTNVCLIPEVYSPSV